MKSLACDCGFTVKNEDHYKVEAQMWHHAVQEHLDMLKQMTPEQLEAWLKNKDKQLSLA